MPAKANAKQIAKVQVVFNQMASREMGMQKTREARLQWASELLQRKVDTFSSLTRSEAIHLIDQAQGAIGIEYVAPKPRTREQARRAGLDGRKDVDHEFANMPQLVSDEDMLAVFSLRDRLGMSDERFRAWLASRRSPFRNRESKDIKTKADANQVRWALKRMLQHAGKWDKETA